MNAAELDCYLAAEFAYKACRAAEFPHEDALCEAREVYAAKRQAEILRRVGVPEFIRETASPSLDISR